MASKKKFYAILKGRKPGLYTQWDGPNGAKAQVDGFAGSVYRGFETPVEADYFLSTGGKIMPAAVVGDGGEAAAAGPDYQGELAAGKVVVFTDGASTGNPGPGGYGVVLLFKDQRKEMSGGFRCTTNNRMELLACIVALQTLTRRSQVSIYSDSRYVVNAVELGWARRWRENDWMRAPDSKGDSYPAENADLWAQMLDLLDQQQVVFHWVKGHASNPENERCDALAVQAAHQRGLPDDVGFDARKCRK